MLPFEVAFQVRIFEVGGPPGIRRIGDAQDDEPSAFGCVEDAGAVVEAAGFRAQFTYLIVLEIEYLD